MGEPAFGKFDQHPEYNFECRKLDGTVVWPLSVSGIFEACYLPTGLLDWRPLSAPPPAPPPGRVRLWFQDGLFYFNDGSGAVPLGISAFTQLTDTPASYAGQALKGIRVNAGETALEFADLLTSFLQLVDTPASFAGAGGQVVAVNGAETGLEFVAAGGAGSSGLSHEESYPTVYFGVPVGGFAGNTYNGLVHWPGWTIMDEVHWSNTLGSFLGFSTGFVRETDGTTGRRVNAVQATCNLEEASNFTFSLHKGIPGDFNGFDSGGITLSSRIAFNLATTGSEFARLILEVFDPTNAGDVVVASVSRTVTASDAGYVDLTLPQAALNAIGFAEGDMLRLRVRSECGGFVNADQAFFWLSRLGVAWSGGGGAPPVAQAVEEVWLTFPDTVLAGTAINIQTGTYSGGGPATVAGDTITLPASAALFNADGEYSVHVNGVMQQRGVRALWASSTQLSLSTPMRPGSTLTVRKVN